MNKKQRTTKKLILAISTGLLSISILSGMSAMNVSADPATTTIKCTDGTKKQATPSMKPPNEILNDKDFEYACRNNGGYDKVGETVVCKDDSQQSVKNTLANPKDKLDDKDREAACKGHGGIKEAADDESGGGPECGGAQTAIITCDADNGGAVEDNGIWALLLIIINIMTAGVGVLAIAGIVYGSILYTTAENKADQVKKATDVITNVVIGLIAFALMWAGLNFIIPGGVFS